MKNRKLAVLLAGLLAVSTAIPALAGPASELKDQGSGAASAGQTYQQSSASGAQSSSQGQSSTKAKKEEHRKTAEELQKMNILFVAGGVGTAPVYPQVKWLKEQGVSADVVQGSKNKDLVILEDEMKAVCGDHLFITTDDGSYGFHGMVTAKIEDLVKNEGRKYDLCVAIGPMIMMKFVARLTKELGIPTIASMNPVMVDGTGMCGACRLLVGGKVKFACVDGPEFDAHEIDFDQAMKRSRMYQTEEGRAFLKVQEGATHHGGCGNCGGEA